MNDTNLTFIGSITHQWDEMKEDNVIIKPLKPLVKMSNTSCLQLVHIDGYIDDI